MCCFTGPVLSVRKTRIFGRMLAQDRQLVVYETAFAAAADLAMVLPIPVRTDAREDAVRFVDLSHLPTFFDRLDMALAHFSRELVGAPAAALGGAPYRAPPLVVHTVGHFEASFVPTKYDFGRLDPRFRLPEAVIDALGDRSGYGFVVVKLAKTEHVTRVHPVAFTFPTRDPARVFFPTVHVHDGRVHRAAHFDHALYTTDGARAAVFGGFGVIGGGAIPAHEAGWGLAFSSGLRWTSGELSETLSESAGTSIVDRGERVFCCDVAGTRTNDDAWIDPGPAPDDREITQALERGAAAGEPLWSVMNALHTIRNRRFSAFQSLRNSFVGLPKVEIAAIRPAERGGGSVFWVHARKANLRGPSDLAGAGSLLCGLAPRGQLPEVSEFAIVPLDSTTAVDNWIDSGAKVTDDDASWLRERAR